MSIIVFIGHPSQVYIYCHRCCLEYSSQAIGRSESWGGADVLAKLAGVIVGSLSDGEPHLHSALEEIFVKGAWSIHRTISALGIQPNDWSLSASLIFELVCNLLVSLEINSHEPGKPSGNADDIDGIYMSSIMAMSILGPLCFKSVNNADEGHIYVMHVDVLAYMSLKYRNCVNADDLLIICRACECFGVVRCVQVCHWASTVMKCHACRYIYT